jgi:hypothetical protein
MRSVNSIRKSTSRVGMAEVSASLASLAQVAVENYKDERTITQAEWLRTELIRAAERIIRFNEGRPSQEDRAGQN